MKTLTTILGLFIITMAFGQTAADKVLGKWYTDDKETIVEI